jgi:hypothetical protein
MIKFGVQSSTMALMFESGELFPKPDCAIFADTQAEPDSVYKWLEWLEKQLSFPIYKVSYGNLTIAAKTIVLSKTSGNTYLKKSLPVFTKNQDGKKGIMRRQCTTDYKIRPIQSFISKLTKPKKADKQRIYVKQYMGISIDEYLRMRKSRIAWIENTYPLIENNISRENCIEWMHQHNYPTPPLSMYLLSFPQQ